MCVASNATPDVGIEERATMTISHCCCTSLANVVYNNIFEFWNSVQDAFDVGDGRGLEIGSEVKCLSEFADSG